jgi:hypothetical protein
LLLNYTFPSQHPILSYIFVARGQWFTPIILATQEAEIRRTAVQSQPRQVIHETLSGKKSFIKKGW